MNQQEAHLKARELMNHYGLYKWTLKWNKARSAAGTSQRIHWSEKPEFSTGVLTFSARIFEVLSEKDQIDTILHEIAHALTPMGVQPHGPEWKAIHRSMGGTGKVSLKVDTPMARKYTGVCPNGHTIQRDRRDKGSCSRCAGHFDRRYMFVWRENTRASQPATRAPEPVAASRVRTPAPSSRAAAFDQGAAFIDWD